MPDPQLEGATLPQAKWDPPGAELDFDALFGGAGDGSSDIVQVEEAQTQVVEPSTSVEEPTTTATQESEPQVTTSQDPTQTTYTQDPKTGVFLKTRTGKVYHTPEEAIDGVEEADRTIANLRKMVEAVTGPISLKKLNQQTQSTEVNYHETPDVYARDLERAAEYGQKTKDWRLYSSVQSKFMSEEIDQRVGQYAPVVQRTIRQEALDTTTKEIPEFKEFYGTEAYSQALDSRPKLKQAVEYAEQNPQAQGDLPELYKSVFDAHVRRQLPTLLKQPQSSNPTNPRMPLGKSTMTAPKVVTERNQPNAPAASLSTSAGRKALMAELEAKGVLDRQL